MELVPYDGQANEWNPLVRHDPSADEWNQIKKHWPELKDLALKSVGRLSRRATGAGRRKPMNRSRRRGGRVSGKRLKSWAVLSVGSSKKGWYNELLITCEYNSRR
jgi:hypothetical protein